MEWKKGTAVAAIIAVAGTAYSTQQAQALTLADYAVFANNEVTMGAGATVHQGAVGTNNALSLVDFGGNGDFQLITGGGSLDAGSGGNYVGSIVFDGNAEFGGNTTIVGNIDSSGNVSLGAGSEVLKNVGVGGNITASGNVTLGGNNLVEGNVLSGGNVSTGAGTTIDGDVSAQGNATFAGNNTVGGNISHGGTFSTGSNFSHGGSVDQSPQAVNPAQFVPVAMPGASVITPGLTSYAFGGNQNLTLAPDAYNNVNAGAGFDLFLSSGTYEFNTLDLGGNAELFLDLSSGDPINIFIASNLIVGAGFNMYIRDTVDGTYYNFAQVLADPSLYALTENIYWEVHGKVDIGGNANVFGTFFHDNATQTIDFGAGADLIGALYSTNKVRLGGNATVHYSLAKALQPTNGGGPGDIEDPPTGDAIPEPATAVLGLASLAALGVATRRRRA